MRGRIWTVFGIAFGVVILAAQGKDWKTVAAEADPVRRSRQALGYGEDAASQAGRFCKAGEYERCVELVDQVLDSVELAKKSLDESGIDAARNSRHHKNAEIQTRRILKLLEAAGSYIHPEDQEHFDKTLNRISDINDELLLAIMSRRRR
jgi:hypothetical protein